MADEKTAESLEELAVEDVVAEPVETADAIDSEEQAEAQARAEKEAREAEERAARRAAEAAQREERAQKAVETLASSAGFVGRAGVYYDASHGTVEIPQGRVEVAATAEESPEQTPEDAVEHFSEQDYIDEIAFSRQVARLTESVVRHPLHRELMYKVLVYCQDSRDLTDLENKIATFPEFERASTDQYHIIETLERAGGLERFELDEEGDLVTPERKEGLTEDEIDDLVWSYAFMTTPAGVAVVEQHTPRARIIELLDLVPDRKDTYVELLDFCSEEPRSYNEICSLLKGRDSLVRFVDGEPQTMQPSVFVDKLESAGGMEWRNGWVLTEEGRAYLEELRAL